MIHGVREDQLVMPDGLLVSGVLQIKPERSVCHD